MTIGKISPLSKGLLCVASPHSLLDSAFRLRSTVTNSAEIYEEAEAKAIGTEYVRADFLASTVRRRCACSLGTTSLSAFCSIRASSARQALRQIDLGYCSTASRSVVRGPSSRG